MSIVRNTPGCDCCGANATNEDCGFCDADVPYTVELDIGDITTNSLYVYTCSECDNFTTSFTPPYTLFFHNRLAEFGSVFWDTWDATTPCWWAVALGSLPSGFNVSGCTNPFYRPFPPEWAAATVRIWRDASGPHSGQLTIEASVWIDSGQMSVVMYESKGAGATIDCTGTYSLTLASGSSQWGAAQSSACSPVVDSVWQVTI